MNENKKISKSKGIHNVHDKFFKQNMGKLEIAKSFFINYLPGDLVKRMDLNNIEIRKDSFVENDMKEYFTDLLYKVDMDNREAYLYTLLEHKSTVEKSISLQLLRYMLNIWQKESKTEDLPVIVPIVFYHGSENWNIDKSFLSMFRDFDGKHSIEHIPDYRYIIINLKKIEFDKVKGIDALKAMMTLLKYDQGEISKFGIKKVYSLLSGSLELIETYTLYILSTTEIQADELSDVVKEIISEEEEGLIMTTAERLKNQGIEEGIEKGIEKGLRESKLEIAKNLLGLGTEIEFVSKGTGLSIEEVKKIKKSL